MRKKAKFGHFLVCVFIVIVSTVGFYFWDLEQAKVEYINENNIPQIYHPADETWIIGHDAYYTQPELAYNEIGDKFKSVLWHSFFFLLLYPLLGRFFVLIAQGLTSLFDTLAEDLNIRLDEKLTKLDSWTPELILYGAVLSPITILSIGLLIIANLLMFIYRFLI